MQSPLFLQHPAIPWTLDATTSRASVDALDALDWSHVFAKMSDLESGEIANPDEERQVGHYWLRDPMMAPTMGQVRELSEGRELLLRTLEEVNRGALRPREGARFTHVLWIGIGGSALGPRLLCQALGESGLAIRFLDNVDPDGITKAIDEWSEVLPTTLVAIASKSGSTPEPNAALSLVQAALEARGLDLPSRAMAVTVTGSKLHQRATKERWRAILPLWNWIGGRFSTTSAVGLLPAGLAGVDVSDLLEGAGAMDHWTRTTEWRNNPAALLAGLWFVLSEGTGEKNVVVLPYRDNLSTLAQFMQQLVMESIGKATDQDGRTVHQGLTVYGNKGSTDQHAYIQQLRDGRNDFMALFVQVLNDRTPAPLNVEDGCNTGDLLQGFLLGTRRALTSNGRSSMTLTTPQLDTFAMGGLIALLERAVGFYGTLCNVNAYHQPGVEAGKRAASDMLALSRRIRAAITPVPVALEALAEQVEGDPMETWYICERLVHTRRLTRTDDGRYRSAIGHER